MPFHFSNEEYADMIFMYGFCNGNSRAAKREYQRRFPNRRVPHFQTFAYVYQFSREHGKFPTVANPEHVRRVVHRENEILQVVDNNPSTSIRRVSHQLGVPRSTVWRAIKKENLYPFHVQKVQRLEAGDEAHRLRFCRWILAHRRTVQRILFTDEAQFTRDGINNCRNAHVWAIENPHAVVQTRSQYKFSVNVWCGIYNSHLIGPYVIEGNLTGEVYLNFLRDILPGLLQGIDIRGMWYQHDGARPHFCIPVRDYLSEQYGNRWIGRNGPVTWPPRSPDLTPLDYFLWGYLKSEVYKEEFYSREQLLQKIITVCQNIRNSPDMILRSVTTLIKRCQKCIDAGGAHFENIL
jgi:transposase